MGYVVYGQKNHDSPRWLSVGSSDNENQPCHSASARSYFDRQLENGDDP